MNTWKKSIISIKRNFGKSLILLVLIFLLFALLSSIISISRIIHQNQSNLILRLPNVITAEEVFSFGYEEFNYLTPDIVREIGALSYVDFFNYSSSAGFFSRSLRQYMPLPSDEIKLRYYEIMWNSLTDEAFGMFYEVIPYGLEYFSVIGSSNIKPIEFEEEVVQIAAGRHFTAEEINNGHAVVLISQELAKVNHLEVGSTFELESIFFTTWGANFDNSNFTIFLDYILDHLYASEVYEMEVIGIFDLNREINAETDFHNFHWRNSFLNTIYVPNRFLEDVHTFNYHTSYELWGHLWDETWYFPANNVSPMFVLIDPRDRSAFVQSANEILPSNWKMIDLSDQFDLVFSAIDQMEFTANYILLATVVATTCILSLTVILFLRGRKQEIGIYLALGQKKVSILLQFFCEILIIAITSITLAVFTVTILTGSVSRVMMRNYLAEQFGNNDSSWSERLINARLAWYNPTFDELVELYDTSLSGNDIAILYFAGFGVIFISIIIPTVYVMRLNPKEILEQLL